MTKKLFLSALLVCLCGAFPALADDQAAAKKAVETWLAAHDQARYGETWDASANFVKEKIPKEKWEQMMQSTLGPLGKLESRSLLSSNAVTELPGMPDGKYVVFEYEARFANKKSAVETIIPMVEDGQWKVMTYRIR